MSPQLRSWDSGLGLRAKSPTAETVLGMTPIRATTTAPDSRWQPIHSAARSVRAGGYNMWSESVCAQMVDALPTAASLLGNTFRASQVWCVGDRSTGNVSIVAANNHSVAVTHLAPHSENPESFMVRTHVGPFTCQVQLSLAVGARKDPAEACTIVDRDGVELEVPWSIAAAVQGSPDPRSEDDAISSSPFPSSDSGPLAFSVRTR